MDNRNVWLGSTALVLGTLVLAWSRNLEPMPAAFPRVVSILLVGLGLVTIGPELMAYTRGRGVNEHQAKQGIRWNHEYRLIPMTVVAFFYAYLFKKIGFAILTPFLIIFVSWFLGYRRVWRMVLSAVGITAVLYVLFGGLLGIPIPKSPLFGI